MPKSNTIENGRNSKVITQSNSSILKEKSSKSNRSKGNKNFTYHEYIEQKKPRNHKCRESQPAVLNKLGEHCINLGQSLETVFRDFEGTSIIFTSNGRDGPASGNFSKEGILKIAKRFEGSLRICKANNFKVQEEENDKLRNRLHSDTKSHGNVDKDTILRSQQGSDYKECENNYETKNHKNNNQLIICHPVANKYEDAVEGKTEQREMIGKDKRFKKKGEYMKKWNKSLSKDKGGNDVLPPNIRIYKLDELGIYQDHDEDGPYDMKQFSMNTVVGEIYPELEKNHESTENQHPENFINEEQISNYSQIFKEKLLDYGTVDQNNVDQFIDVFENSKFFLNSRKPSQLSRGNSIPFASGKLNEENQYLRAQNLNRRDSFPQQRGSNRGSINKYCIPAASGKLDERDQQLGAQNLNRMDSFPQPTISNRGSININSIPAASGKLNKRNQQLGTQSFNRIDSFPQQRRSNRGSININSIPAASGKLNERNQQLGAQNLNSNYYSPPQRRSNRGSIDINSIPAASGKLNEGDQQLGAQNLNGNDYLPPQRRPNRNSFNFNNRTSFDTVTKNIKKEKKKQGFNTQAQKKMSIDSKRALEFGNNKGFNNGMPSSNVQLNMPNNLQLNAPKNPQLNAPKNFQYNAPNNNPITRSHSDLTNQGSPQDFLKRLIYMQNVEGFTKIHNKLQSKPSMEFTNIRQNPSNN